MMGKYYFTFMSSDERYCDNYVVFEGTYSEARTQMFDKFGTSWAFQYSETQWYNKDGISQADEFDLTELK